MKVEIVPRVVQVEQEHKDLQITLDEQDTRDLLRVLNNSNGIGNLQELYRVLHDHVQAIDASDYPVHKVVS